MNWIIDVLKNALINKKVRFPDTLQKEYDDKYVFRGVKYNSKKKEINKTDFLSHIERKDTMMGRSVDETDISSYSCSCFLNLDELHTATKFPIKNKAVAKGLIKKDFGPININEQTSHIDLYLFDGVDPSYNFEVVEKWEKNG